MQSGDFIRLRKALKVTQADLATELGVATNSVARWERGEAKVPVTIEKFVRLLADTKAEVSDQSGIGRDEHHQDILEALDRHLDPLVFEACAVDLLNQQYPRLVPIRGGSDGGFDGEIVEDTGERSPLIVTTAKNYKSNFARSVAQARDSATFSMAVFATSRRVTAAGRKALRESARQHGVLSLAIHDQDWFAQALYTQPAWTKRLLNLQFTVDALQPFPKRSERPALEQLLGRDQELRMLRESGGDSLVYGGPGLGKTALLSVFASDVNARFLVDPNRQAIADAVRKRMPAVVIVDDAHVKREALANIVQLRAELDASFRIIASCWPHHVPGVKRLLGSNPQEISVGFLDADTIVKIVKMAGILSHRQLIRVIVAQAEGRPGLAVTLARLCVKVGTDDVWSGKALLDELAPAFQSGLEENITHLLGCFSLGGDRGLPLKSVAEFLGRPLDSISQTLAVLSDAGVIREAWDGSVSVWPSQFRWMLTRRTFFDAKHFDPAPLIQSAPEYSDVVETLIGARSRGASVPTLERVLVELKSPEMWARYASVGSREARFALRNLSEPLGQVTRPLLEWIPDEVLPRLLGSAEATAQSLDALEAWLRKSENTREMPKRSDILVSALERVYALGDVPRTAIPLLCFALDPSYEASWADPGQGSHWTIMQGELVGPELQRTATLWPRAFKLLSRCQDVPWSEVFNLVRRWRAGHPMVRRDDESRELVAAHVKLMMTDLAGIVGRHAGAVHQLAELAAWLEMDLEIKSDKEFMTLYPSWKLVDAESRDEAFKVAATAARAMGERWAKTSPVEVARRVAKFEKQAKEANIRAACHLSSAAQGLASKAENLRAVLQAFVASDLPEAAVSPIVWQLVQSGDVRWTLEALASTSNYAVIALQTMLPRVDVDLKLVDISLCNAAGAASLLEWGMSRIVDESLALHFLEHCDPTIAIAAAIGEWHRSKPPEIRVSLRAGWRRAILRSATEGELQSHYWLNEILTADSELSYEWLTQYLCSDGRRYGLTEAAETAASALEDSRRRAILLAATREWPLHGLVDELVGESAELFDALLKNDELRSLHLEPLSTGPSITWRARVLAAHAHGYPVTDLAHACLPRSRAWSGPESEYWRPREQEFLSLAQDPEPLIANVARAASALVRANREDCLRREQNEAIRGRPD